MLLNMMLNVLLHLHVGKQVLESVQGGSTSLLHGHKNVSRTSVPSRLPLGTFHAIFLARGDSALVLKFLFARKYIDRVLLNNESRRVGAEAARFAS